MILSELVNVLPDKDVEGPVEKDIKKLAYDSRSVEAGGLFVAIKGLATDGHRFIGRAVEQGAVGVVLEERVPVPAGVTVIKVADSRKALSVLAQAFYGYPARHLQVAGITGTNGKTTISYLVEAVFRQAGFTTGVIGTIAYKIGDQRQNAPHTTPESLDLQQLLARMRQEKVGLVAMEVSSHSLALDRLYGMRLDGAVFTNLSRDHLDFHKSPEEYGLAKMRMFTDLSDQATKAVINIDDPVGRQMAKQTPAQVTTYAMAGQADIIPQQVALSDQGTRLTLSTPQGTLDLAMKMLGEFTVPNAMAAAGLALAFGLPRDTVAAGLEKVTGVRGRFEPVFSRRGFTVIIDYAHTPDALEKLLRSVKKVCAGRVVAVFGCGGDRDRGKRPLMGEIATRLADYSIVTSDNPRTEDPQAIIDEIISGIDGTRQYQAVVDRKEAITRAVAQARKGDMVVIAGKGHEDYQIVGTQKIHFDDREIVESLIAG